MEFLNDPLLVFWRMFGDWGLIVVIAAVVAEVAAAATGSILEKFWPACFSKWESRLKRYEVMAGWILVIGLVMEYKGHREETTILDSNNSALYDNGKKTEKDAANAIKFAAELKVRASANELQVAVLSNETVRLSINLEDAKSNNLVLQNRLVDLQQEYSDLAYLQQERMITATQMGIFIESLKDKKDKPKEPIILSVRRSPLPYRANYSFRIHRMLNEAGYTNQLEIRTNETTFLPPPIEVGIFVNDLTNKAAFVDDLDKAFTTLGLKTMVGGTKNGGQLLDVKPDQVLIYLVNPQFDPRYHNQ